MRVAFFSPLPPAKSGIADYSAAVLEHLSRFADVEAFAGAGAFDASRFDIAVYQLGNNPFHTFAYEAALAHPGVVVLHEANLHHLIADLTIRRNDWDAYLREIELNGGAAALAYAKRYVRTLERGPDYDIPMLRSVLARSRAAIVHSEAVASELRARGFAGPIAKIPHGAWLAHGDRMGYRTRLGLNETTPLIGIFGFLKPYKRIAESLRAFKRLVRLVPEARMILVGEAHAELPLASMIQSMNLTAHVRHLDFVPIEDFNGYLSACDIVLNLRYPTVGESSGTLLRALGMGKAVVVSDVGSFREYPDEICLKAPVDSSEEEHLFEYLNLLVSRPELARKLGDRAREWVERECSWESVARRYAEFLQCVVEGSARGGADVHAGVECADADLVVADDAGQEAGATLQDPVTGDYIASWAPVADGVRGYVETHRTRLEKTLAITPPGCAEDRILEMGAYLQITPALRTRLGYGEVRGCYYGPAGSTHLRTVTSETGETFSCEIDLFDAEKDRFPYPDGYFSTVLCCELIEHLPGDPMHLMSEVNRILKPGGHFVLTTPNVVSMRALAGILQGFHPMLFPAYIRPNREGETDSRHAREYTPREIQTLFENSGFEVTLLDTGPFRAEPNPEFGWVEHLLDRYILPKEHRGDGIYAVGRKQGAVRERYPAWLYS
jgi:glycosyltransferase involved in cell wall biosynthesis/SAM-dependent methyltransferase